MKTQYENYYNKLKNTSLVEKSNNLVSFFYALSDSHDKLKTSLDSNLWIELGKEEISKSVVQTMIKHTKDLENNVKESLVKACSLTQNDLYNLLVKLDKKEKELAILSEEEKPPRLGEISSIEREIDSKISEINNLNVSDLIVSPTPLQTDLQINFQNLPKDISDRKKLFLGNVDNPAEYTVHPNYVKMRKELRLFNNKTGEEIKPGSVVRLKKGEQLILTVKLPTNTGMIGELKRTTADGDHVARTKRVVHTLSDVNPDPNIVDFVNYKSWANHKPPGVNLHTNHYDWIINGKDYGSATVSQTAEYTANNAILAKAMTSIKVVVE